MLRPSERQDKQTKRRDYQAYLAAKALRGG
jgi:hypothetical protein